MNRTAASAVRNNQELQFGDGDADADADAGCNE